MGVQALLSFTPLPKSKSQIFTGDTWAERRRKNIILLFSIPLGTTSVLLKASCPFKATYLISVFTKDVLQLKVSVGNACRKAQCGFFWFRHGDSFFLWTLVAVWMLTYLLCARSQELGQCPWPPCWPPAHQSAFCSGCVSEWILKEEKTITCSNRCVLIRSHLKKQSVHRWCNHWGMHLYLPPRSFSNTK